MLVELKAAIDIVAAIAAGVAAYLWHRASRNPVPPRAIHFDETGDYLLALATAAETGARLNRRAALVSAISAALVALSLLLSRAPA